MKRDLRKYLLGIRSLSAWERKEILDYVDNLYTIKKSFIIFKTALFIMSIIACVAILLFNLVFNG